VGDITARTQQAAHRAAQRQAQERCHQIEDARAAGRNQHLVALEQTLGVAGRGDVCHALHQRAGIGRVGLGFATGAQAFITLDAHQLQRLARMQGARQCQRGARVAHAGTAARHADLEQHLERRDTSLRRMPAFDQRALRQ
jgi:hypothetical protein